MTRVLVTGGSGFIGRAVVRQARAKGYTVRVTSRRQLEPTFFGEGVECVQVQGLGPDANWTDALRTVDVVIHLAARVHVMSRAARVSDPEFHQANFAGTLQLARAAASAGVNRFIFVSTAGVTGKTSEDRPLRESDPVRPITPYAIAKLAAEEGLRTWSNQTGIACTIVRPPMVYGPDAPGNPGRLLALVARGLPLPFASVRNQRSMVGVDNLAHFLLSCSTHPRAVGQTFNVADGSVSTAELVRILAAGMKRPARLVPVPLGLLRWGARLAGRTALFDQVCGSLLLDCTLARERLGWQPVVPMEAGLLAMSEHFRSTKISSEHDRIDK
jgi:nucleoside-diphosphate-sugar epimerase